MMIEYDSVSPEVRRESEFDIGYVYSISGNKAFIMTGASASPLGKAFSIPKNVTLTANQMVFVHKPTFLIINAY